MQPEDSKFEKLFLGGDEAVAWAALDANVMLGTGYPGTPSTEILETFERLGGRAQWAPNEKVALEVGIGAAFAGARSLVTMKHVGLNVAADALLALDKGGTPYVVFIDDGWPGAASVMKYDGGSWVNVGSPGFTDGYVAYVSIAIDASGTPYVAYLDGEDGAATVKKFTGGSWVNVGGAMFTPGPAAYTQIAIDNTGIPYLAYSNYVLTNTIEVMKYDGGGWTDVGSAGFALNYASNISLALNAGGEPSVFFLDGNDSNKTTVMKFNGSWANTGSPDFSSGLLSAPYMGNIRAMALDSSGTPYVCFEDTAHGNRATVMKMGYPAVVKSTEATSASLAIFPNPSCGTFTVAISSVTSGDATIIVTNAVGEKVKELIAKTNQRTQITLDSPPGVYFVNTVVNNEQMNAKVLLW